VIGMERGGSDVDVNVVSEEIFSQTPDFFRPGCGPHQYLTIGPNLFDDFANLGLKTHVKHSENETHIKLMFLFFCLTIKIFHETV
jgi:hypothetical protein